LLKSNWIWFQPENHYYHFTKNSLIYLLNNSGFKTIEIKRQKPNNLLTNKSLSLSNKVFNKYLKSKNTFLDFLKHKYEYITGAEVYAVAKKTSDTYH
jgi:hypothetical protein